MKKGSFKCLVMREFYMCRKKIIPLLIVFMGLVVPVLLLQLSLKVGNLAQLPEEIRAEFMEMFRVFCFLPIGVANSMLEGVSASSAIEGEAKWKRFRLASPVKPIKFAAAKYSMMLMLFTMSTLLVAVYIKLIDVMNVVVVDKDFVAMAMMIFMVMLVYEVAIQVLSMLFGSVDKAGMTLMGVSLVAMICFFPNIESGPDADVLLYEKVVSFCRGFMQYVPICILAAFAAGFGATTMLYKRREK